MTTTNHMVIRFTINTNTRLSMANWVDAKGVTTYAVAIQHKVGSKWSLDHATCAEFRAHGAKDWQEEDACYRATSYAASLVRDIYKAAGEEMPLRFFRDNVIGKR